MLSVIIITKNEEDIVRDCIAGIKDIADEIIVIDSNSTDNTVKIAEKSGARTYINPFIDFSSQRNFALSKAKCDWILYLDADERATENFKMELKNIMKEYSGTSNIGGFFINRRNFFYGKDWNYIDKMQRLFVREKITGWKGKVHEQAVVKGELGEIKSPVLHYTHNNLAKMVEKTNEWSEFEAELRIKANHPKMNIFRFIRIVVTGFVKSYFSEGGFRNGTEGFIEAIYQSFSIFITYAKLWEKQMIKST